VNDDQLKSRWTRFWSSFFGAAWVILVVLLFVALLVLAFIREMRIWGS
jgi:hypothetical protein